MANANTKVLTAHVPLPLAEKVDQLANRLERSRGWVIKQALSASRRVAPGYGGLCILVIFPFLNDNPDSRPARHHYLHGYKSGCSAS